jgi:hypothetical protein
MFEYLDKILFNELDKLKDLLSVPEEAKKSKLKKVLHYAATIVFLVVALTILIKGTLDLRDYILDDLLAGNSTARGIFGGIFKTSLMVVFLIIAYMFVIRILLMIKKIIQPYQIAGFLGLFVLVTNLVTNLLEGDQSFWEFSAKFAAKTIGIGE